MPAGRPTKYSLELADYICQRTALGESMRSICRDEKLPNIATIFRWLREHQEFCDQYTKAKEMSADSLADEMLDIADQIEGQIVMVDGLPLMQDGKLVKVIDNVSVNHARLRVDTRKWAASKLKPKKYGDKIMQEVTGKDGGPIDINHAISEETMRLLDDLAEIESEVIEDDEIDSALDITKSD